MGAAQYKSRCHAMRGWAAEATPGYHGTLADKCVLLFGRNPDGRKVDIVVVHHEGRTFLNDEWRQGTELAPYGVTGWVRRMLEEALATSSSNPSLFALMHIRKHPELYTLCVDAPDKNVSRLCIDYIWEAGRNQVTGRTHQNETNIAPATTSTAAKTAHGSHLTPWHDRNGP